MDAKPAFQPKVFRDLASYKAHVTEVQGQPYLETTLRTAHPEGEFTVPGYCWYDGARVDLVVDYLYASGGEPNWRERLVCPACRLNNRHRATMHLIGEMGLRRSARAYITEQITPLYFAVRTRYPSLVGSEFLGPQATPGSVDGRGIRHEDVMRLSFPDQSLDAIFTFDVLEHVPDYRRALSECARVLKPGGVILISIPFLDLEQDTRVRASLAADGTLVHHHPPVYHGDPLSTEGVLCYHDFGWDFLDALREAGFEDAAAIGYRSVEYGYLGGLPLMFQARKAGGQGLRDSALWKAFARFFPK